MLNQIRHIISRSPSDTLEDVVGVAAIFTVLVICLCLPDVA